MRMLEKVRPIEMHCKSIDGNIRCILTEGKELSTVLGEEFSDVFDKVFLEFKGKPIVVISRTQDNGKNIMDVEFTTRDSNLSMECYAEYVPTLGKVLTCELQLLGGDRHER